MELMRRRRGIMGLNGGAGIPVITATATGNPLTFETDLVRPLKSLVIPFTPIQSGSGDPSPTNVRPISGWTGCNVISTGYNLLNLGVTEATPGALIDGKRILEPYKYYPGFHGSSINYFSRSYITDFSVAGQSCSFTASQYAVGITFLVKGGTRIKGSITGTNVDTGYIQFFDKDWNVISGAWGIKNGENVPSNAIYAMARIVAVTANQPSTVTNYTIAYETGTVDSQLFEGTTIPINWQTEAGTVYGGTLTLNEDGSADLVATWIYGTPDYSKLGGNSWSEGGYRDSYNYMDSGALLNFPNSADYTKIISDKATRGSFSQTNTNPVVMAATGNYIYFGVKSELLESDDLTGLRAYLVEHAPVICYPLRQQDYITYHFDNIGQLITFAGTNNIWTDTNGTNTATYLKHQS